MEEEKSAIELLKDFAKKTGRQINISEKRHPSIGIKGRVFHKNYAIISDKKNHNGYFVNYFDAKQFDDNAKYSGFFFSIDAPSTSKIQIRKKNILNKLNPFFKKNRFTSRYQDFDSQAIITENDLNLTSNIFRNRKFQNLTLKVLNIDERLAVGVNNIKIDIVPELKDKSTFGFYIKNEWLLDDYVNEKLFKILTDFTKISL